MKASKGSSLKIKLKKIILEQARRHPGFKVEDLYKLLYQAVFGGGHLLDYHGLPMLEEEIANLSDYKKRKKEPLFELIDPKGSVYRINLRPFKKAGGDPGVLFWAMMESAQVMKGDQKEFLKYWELCAELARKGSIPFREKTIADFKNFFEKNNFPVIHHSPAYMEADRPAYRLVVKKFLKRVKPLI